MERDVCLEDEEAEAEAGADRAEEEDAEEDGEEVARRLVGVTLR